MEWKNEYGKKGIESKKKNHKTNVEIEKEAMEAALEMEAVEEPMKINEQKRRENLILLSSKGYWNGLARDGYMKQLEEVLPMFYGQLKLREEGVPTTKTAMKPLLSEFLDNLKNVSESKEESVKCLFGSSTDLTRLDKWCRLELYVQVKECIQIQEKERKEKALVDVMYAFGTVIADTFT